MAPRWSVEGRVRRRIGFAAKIVFIFRQDGTSIKGALMGENRGSTGLFLDRRCDIVAHVACSLIVSFVGVRGR